MNKTIFTFFLMLIGWAFQPAFAQPAGCQASFQVIPDSSGHTFTFVNTSAGTYTHVNWSFDDGTSSTQAQPVHQYANGAYIVCLTIYDTSGTGCQAISCDTLIVGPSGGCNASFVYSTNPGSTSISFTNISSGGFTNVQWAFGDGTFSSQLNPSHVYPAPGNYAVCLTVSAPNTLCSSTTCDSITVPGAAACDAHFNAYDTTGQVVFIPAVYNQFWTYSWSFGDGTGSNQMSPSHSYNSAGPHYVCLTVTDSLNNCTQTICDTVYQNSQPLPCNAYISYQVASNGVVYFYGYNNGGGTVSSYHWVFSDGTTSTQQNPVHTFNAAGTYSVCLIIQGPNCSDSTCASITIQAPASCDAMFGYQASPSGQVYFNGWNNGGGTVNTWTWYFGDGTSDTSQFPFHQYNSPGTYTVCLYIQGPNCADSTCSTVTIQAAQTCDAQFSYQTSSNGDVYFYGYNNGGGAITSYQWNFGDGTTGNSQSPMHQYAQSGTYTVCLTIMGSGCVDSICSTVVVNTNPVNCSAQISYQIGANGVVYFYGYNANPSGALTTYNWYFSDGGYDTVQSPVHQFNASGSYMVCLYLQTANCADSTCIMLNITVGPQTCDANFTAFDSSGYIYFIPDVYNQGWNYVWNFGDGTSSTQPYAVHTFTSGYHIVCLTITDSSAGCYATVCDTILAGQPANCAASFTWSTNPNGVTTFTNTSTGGYTNSSWYFGDGTASTQNNPTHTFPANGTYLVCVTVYNNNGCQSTYCDSVIIGSGGNNCVPVFYAVSDSTFGNGGVSFYILNNCNGVQYTWSFGDGTSGTGNQPQHQYNSGGWFNICVTATGPGVNITYCDSVYVLRIAGIGETSNTLPVHLSPNPGNGYIRLDLNLLHEAKVELMSTEGRVLETDFDTNTGAHSQNFDFTRYASGLYLLRITSGSQHALVKLIIQH